MARFSVVVAIAAFLAFLACSCSERDAGEASKASKVAQADGREDRNAAPAKSIIGKWEMADGSDYVIEFTRDGTMSVKNGAGERQVRLPGNKDLPYAFISETEVKAATAPATEYFKEQFFLFSVGIDGDKLTIRGKEGGQRIILSQDGVTKVLFPGSVSKPLEFVRQK